MIFERTIIHSLYPPYSIYFRMVTAALGCERLWGSAFQLVGSVELCRSTTTRSGSRSESTGRARETLRTHRPRRSRSRVVAIYLYIYMYI